MSHSHANCVPVFLVTVAFLLVVVVVSACTSATPLATPPPTAIPTWTVQPTYTPYPTYTPPPTSTPVPTATLTPTHAPSPTSILRPTYTSQPTTALAAGTNTPNPTTAVVPTPIVPEGWATYQSLAGDFSVAYDSTWCVDSESSRFVIFALPGNRRLSVEHLLTVEMPAGGPAAAEGKSRHELNLIALKTMYAEVWNQSGYSFVLRDSGVWSDGVHEGEFIEQVATARVGGGHYPDCTDWGLSGFAVISRLLVQAE